MNLCTKPIYYHNTYNTPETAGYVSNYIIFTGLINIKASYWVMCHHITFKIYIQLKHKFCEELHRNKYATIKN
jgi:hypothetical protein